VEKTVIVKGNSGFHARPASMFVAQAGKFQSEVKIETNGKQGNGKSLLNLLALGIVSGQSMTIITEGPDAEAALAHLADFVENQLAEV
jgi:phosphocarrier protein HPr